MIWYTSDTHFGHTNIIKYCNRPFRNTHEMNEALISNWNEKVRPEDEVWHLGDFAFGKGADFERIKVIFNRLNGRKNLILGNHDKRGQMERLGWDSIQDVKMVRDGAQDFWLSHYKHAIWPKSHRGVLHLFGHSHGTAPNTDKSLDVGVDPCAYHPVDAEEILKRLSKEPSHASQDRH